MAGSEKRGVEFARADLFQGATCITTPTADTSPSALQAVEAFWRTIGMRVTQLSPEDHDRLICDISHLPHALAAALIAMQTEAALPLAGKGFLDSTRIAGGDGGLWRDIFLDNRDNLAASATRLRSRLDELLRMLDAGDADAVRDWLTAAAQRREQLLQQKLRELNAD
jgi:prephenate dehydrogenase